jgi:hypothetical protein
MNSSRLRRAIGEALAEVLGKDIYIRGVVSGRLRDRTRVFRVIGNSPWYPGSLFVHDGGIWLRTKDGPRLIPDDDGEHDDLKHDKWECCLLRRGPKVIERELRAALQRRDYQDIEVQVGGDNAYPTSIAFKYRDLDEDKKPGPPELSLLFNSLPPAGSSWPAQQRKRWFETAERMFDLMYGPAP